MTDKWRQRPVWCTDWGTSSGLYIACSSLHTYHSCQLLTERVCRLLALPSPTLTKELELKRRHELYQTTKATGGRYLPGLGKASMLQTPHPQLFLLGGGWFKISWLKTPGPPARASHQQGTAGGLPFSQAASYWLVTTEKKRQCQSVPNWFMSFISLQPYEHRLCRAQPCRFWRAALLCSPDVAP
eukprot:2637062-Amphidinium_carterae.1